MRYPMAPPSHRTPPVRERGHPYNLRPRSRAQSVATRGRRDRDYRGCAPCRKAAYPESSDIWAHPRPISAHQKQSRARSEEHTSELQSLMRISYAVFCLKKKKSKQNNRQKTNMQQEILKKQ